MKTTKLDKKQAEQRMLELERELEIQKTRFLVASREGISAAKADLSIVNWVRTYPREAAILIMVGGFMAAGALRSRRQRSRYGAPQEVG